jgi:membrane protein required for colicin V production
MTLGGVDVGTLDLALGAVLLVSAIVGLWRGLVFEVLSLIGWVVAYIVAQRFTPAVAAVVPVGSPGSALNYAVAFALIFIAALVGWSLAARLARALLRATPLSAVDRALGVLFGLLRGVVVLLLVATLTALTPMHQAPTWRSSQIAQGLDAMLRGLKPLLPVGVAQHIRA